MSRDRLIRARGRAVNRRDVLNLTDRGQVVFGKVGDRSVVVFEGRVHYYEGNTMAEVTFCTRVIGRLGTKTLILTNASGAINLSFARGHLILATRVGLPDDRLFAIAPR